MLSDLKSYVKFEVTTFNVVNMRGIASDKIRQLVLFILKVVLIVKVLAITLNMSQTAMADEYVVSLTERDAETIGQKIWQNETGGKWEDLIAWNEGETFASLGIGHFIWYPPGQEGPFKEVFPDVLDFFQRHDVKLPIWLSPTSDCPWQTRAEFLKSLQSQEMHDLRSLLTSTIPQQVRFVVRRLEAALPKILAVLPTTDEQERIRVQFYRVAATSQGLYILVDYVNFKGEGISETERYQGQGWGLLQVLQQMPGNTPNAGVEFADAAEFVLTRRVLDAPPERRDIEARWLPGWKNRIETYRQGF